MNSIFCPRCSSVRLENIGEGIFMCLDCRYTGSLDGKGIIKK